MKTSTYFGNSWLGLFLRGNNEHVLMPIDAMDKLSNAAKEYLKAEPVKTLIGGSNLVGLYVAMNSKGAILPNVATAEEVSLVKTLGLNVHRSAEHQNAHGNNLAINDKGGLVNPNIPHAERRKMEDVLGIELVEASIAGYPTVGSCVTANNKGFITHFRATEEEMKLVESALKVKGLKGSVNTGTGFLPLGVVANDKGYLAGEQTSAFEMGRIEEALDFIL